MKNLLKIKIGFISLIVCCLPVAGQRLWYQKPNKDNVAFSAFAEMAPHWREVAVVIDTVTGLYGYAKPNGDVVVDCKYYRTYPFFNGRGKVTDAKTRLSGYVNSKGEQIIPCDYSMAEDFSEGLAAVHDARTGKGGFIDTDRNVVIPFIYDRVHSFGYCMWENRAFPGLAYVNVGMSTDGRSRIFPDGKWGEILK
jgi:hypothetical protein